MTIESRDFSEFYCKVHGYSPFPWQMDLLEKVLSRGSWPDLIDIPTGMGKTCLLDIAVFIAAKTSCDQGPKRVGRRRIFFVVDRRIVVDEAYEHAKHLSKLLDDAVASNTNTALYRVAKGLKTLAPYADRPLKPSPDQPVDWSKSNQSISLPRHILPVTRMRGGVTWDATWLDRPDIPGIVIGTVDQIGSRILFRGYGLSQRRAPIDAALVGNDSLILIDEAHLATVMISTLKQAFDRDVNGIGLPRAQIVKLTATSHSGSTSSYRLNIHDHCDNEVAMRRLNASKQLSLVQTNLKGVVGTMVDQAIALLQNQARTILVVCNTVNRAREVYAELGKRRKPETNDVTISLLIGRSRPVDRETLILQLQKRFGLDCPRDANVTPAILVATQTVEVGANFDVDGLVTESAPWDSLVQRLGRLNRLGNCQSPASAVVVDDGVRNGPIYGEARDVTWEFLRTAADRAGGKLDVSPLACRKLAELAQKRQAGVYAPQPLAPLVTTPILDSWVRTGPAPVPDTPVAPYLHGLGHDFATVGIAWRDGLLDSEGHGRDDFVLNDYLSAVPILSEEVVEVALSSVRRWMKGESVCALSDLDEELGSTDDEKVERITESFPALTWRNTATKNTNRAGPSTGKVSGSWVWIDSGDLRPGDILVVPTEKGGLDEYGWAPNSTSRVLDVSEVIRSTPSRMSRYRPLLRVDADTPVRLGLLDEDVSEIQLLITKLGQDSADDNDVTPERQLANALVSALDKILQRNDTHPQNERLPGVAWTPAALSTLRSWLREPITVVPIQQDSIGDNGKTSLGFLLTPSTARPWQVERDDELPECSSMSTAQVPLRIHHTNVAARAREIAESLGLKPDLVAAVETAAQWHDLGKLESRFQAMLCGGNQYEAMLADEPLAKSGMDPADRIGYRIARRLSGLPEGTRHEAWSAGLVRECLTSLPHPSPFDPDLVIHLVASHHGHARPWLPPVEDPAPQDISAILHSPTSEKQEIKVSINSANTVDFDSPGRFAILNQRYGRWGLALLESIVRCADITVSKEGS